jgi:hypothetical protein
VIQDEGTGQVPRVTPTVASSRQASEVTFATEVGGDPTGVMEVALVTCQLMECTLGGTLLEHPQYYLLKVMARPSLMRTFLAFTYLQMKLHLI